MNEITEKMEAMHPGITTKGDRLVVGVSGGKDSGALCLMLKDHGFGPDDYDRVFCDTGWELPEVYDYLRGPLTDAVGPITELRPEIALSPRLEEIAAQLEERMGHHSGMVRFILKKGMFPGRIVRFCTQELKAKLSAAHLRTMDAEPINVIGIRADESAARSTAIPWDWSELHDCWTWRPILQWTWPDVIAIHQRHNLSPAPPYLAGAKRVGCAPCIMARKSEIAWLADQYPDRMTLLGDLERAVSWLAAEKAAAKGKEFKHGRAWFQDPNPPRGKDGKVISDFPGYDPVWPIDRVIKWAQGPRNQVELFAGRKEDAGCMRWGFCDTGAPEEVTP